MASGLDHDSLAYKARIAAHLLNVNYPGVTKRTVTGILNALWNSRYTSKSGRAGFGLDYAWDAFADGSTDPSTTIYSYTTASAALAFLDGYVVTRDSALLTEAKELATTLLTDCWGYTSGATMSVWYSDQAADHVNVTYVVHNVNALTLAVLARLDRYSGLAFQMRKRAGIEAMLVAQDNADGVNGQWRYRLDVTGNNDLTHASYMMEGVHQARMSETTGALSHLWSFFNSDGTFNTESIAVMGSKNWGPGEGLSALSTDPNGTAKAALVANVLAESVSNTGVSSYAIATEPRSVARYGLGLARFAARVLGDGALFR